MRWLNKDMPHTPRLCIDSRTAWELPQTGILTQELIDQLVAANGEEGASEWIQKHRTVLLSHPGQVFSGQLRRYETKRKVGTSPLYWLWEKEFVKTAGISFFHRFRAIDQMNVACAVMTLTTVLPPRKKLPFFITRRPNQYFCVPSEKDLELLKEKYQIAKDRIFVARPAIRRFLHFQELQKPEKPLALFLVGEKENTAQLTRLLKVVKSRFPHLENKVVTLKNKEKLGPKEWLLLCSNAQICFYLTAKPFDWGTLALETLFYKIPTIFNEENGSLRELLPQSALTLTRFLVEQPEQDGLLRET
ncbi:MAG: hypothetical protein ACKN9V_06225, partial [Pseudomonadota bacterium]